MQVTFWNLKFNTTVTKELPVENNLRNTYIFIHFIALPY